MLILLIAGLCLTLFSCDIGAGDTTNGGGTGGNGTTGGTPLPVTTLTLGAPHSVVIGESNLLFFHFTTNGSNPDYMIEIDDLDPLIVQRAGVVRLGARDLPITLQEFMEFGPTCDEPDSDGYAGARHFANYTGLATSTGHLFWIDFGDDVSGTVRVDVAGMIE
ncbi:MAG: hypothetical protein EA382_17640 [Spirochaetaceae bacterium]|nr:MAG: hypothetical protein EA382_17640 [Spirochaetaceae bacterium]